MALSSLYRKSGKYFVVIWDKNVQKSKVKIKYREPINNVFFGGNNFVVVQEKYINIYDTEKYLSDGKFTRPTIMFSFMCRINNFPNLLTISRDSAT